jgi:hypothetical protein
MAGSTWRATIELRGDVAADSDSVPPRHGDAQRALSEQIGLSLGFGKQDFVYQPAADVYRCPAGKTLKYRYTNVENGLTLRRYWTTTCPHISSVGPRTSKSSRHKRRCCGASKIGRSSLWAEISWPLRQRCRLDRLSCAGSSLLRLPGPGIQGRCPRPWYLPASDG